MLIMPKAKIFKTETGWNTQVLYGGMVKFHVEKIGDFATAFYWAVFYQASFLNTITNKFMAIAERMTVN